MNTTTSTNVANLKQDFYQQLIQGDRSVCRGLIEQCLLDGAAPLAMLTDLIWPTMEMLQTLYRDDRISTSQFNLATRLNRNITDQLTAMLERKCGNGQTVLLVCGDNEPEELGGQICADLFEAEGYTVRFAGGGVPNDEVLKMIGEFRPNLLVLFATLPSGMPAVRKLIDYLREVNSCPEMQVMCCGGIYKRAEGLAEEIGADLYAADAASAIDVARTNPTRKATAEQHTVGRMRRVRKPVIRNTEESIAEAA